MKSYFKFLSRNKGYTAVNLVGFSAALMFVVLLGLYIHRETRVDRFHEKGDRIFRMTSDYNDLSWPARLPAEVQARYPEIEDFTRFYEQDRTVDTPQGKIRVTAITVDPSFFRIFSFPLIAGDRAAQLRTPSEVTISRRFATRMFGSEDALGKPLTIDDKPYTVTGVAGDFENSHFADPDLIVQFEGNTDPWYFTSNYNAYNFPVYLLIRENADLHPQLADMADWFRTFLWRYEEGEATDVQLEPLAESYYNAENTGYDTYRMNDKRAIRIFGLTALVVLLFAVINYINLSVAQSGFRAREAATRRLLGGTRGGLLAGYIAESVLFCAASLVIALLLAGASEPAFNRLMESDIAVRDVLTPTGIVLCAGAMVVLGVVSGLIPALILTRAKPIEVVRGEFTRKTRTIYSRLFIGLQFGLTIVLLGCTITIRQQTRFMRTTDLGFDTEQLITLENLTPRNQLSGLRDALMRVPGVELVSFTSGTPVNGGLNNSPDRDDGSRIYFQVFTADSLFFPILGFDIVSRTGIVSDTAVWVNQTLLRALNLPPDADHFKLYRDEPIAGVVRDFHIDQLQEEIRPAVIRIVDQTDPRQRGTPWDILVKIDSADPGETFRQVQAAYADYNGGVPFESGFVDAEIDSWYDEQEKTYKIMGAFALIAVLISALGLLAMATYFMRQRAREVAVRKVFGATSREVLDRLILSFLKIVAVAYVAAVPVIGYAMNRWLSTFAYRIPLRWTIFAAAGAIAGAIALAAVFWQSRRTANANPVETLHKG